MRALVLYVVPLVLFGGGARASFCGPAAVPFSFEALPDGHPVLGCARPTCFGWSAQGKPAGAPSLFYRVNGKPDGYFRKSADPQTRPFADGDAAFFQPQTATCASTFDSDQCASETQWVGGIGPLGNVSGLPLALQCCDYDSLLISQDRGIAAVKPGQIVIGGEILANERQYAFDFISDVVKKIAEDGSVSYDVYVRRLPCLPQPQELTIQIESSVYTEIGTRFAKKSKFDRKGNKAYQAPIQEFGENTNLANTALENLNNAASNTVVQEGAGSVVDNQEGAVPAGRVISQSERVVLEPTGQESVQVVNVQQPVAGGDTVVQGPFVADGEAVEVVDAIQGLELPEGQVPEGLIQQPVAAAPAYAGGYGGGYGSGGRFCFSADTRVRLQDGSEKRMDELKVNDWVLSANRSSALYTPVESWAHRLPEEEAEFYHFTLDGGKDLKLTSKHFIYKSKCEKEGRALKYFDVSIRPVYAENVMVGECLYAYEEGNLVERRVVKSEVVVEKGIYAPMTSNGDIMVNDIFASCYNIVNSEIMQRSFFDHFGVAKSLLANEQGEIHLPLVTSVIIDLMEYVLPKSLLF